MFVHFDSDKLLKEKKVYTDVNFTSGGGLVVCIIAPRSKGPRFDSLWGHIQGFTNALPRCLIQRRCCESMPFFIGDVKLLVLCAGRDH